MAFMSDSDEEAMIMANKQSKLLFEEAGRDKTTLNLNASEEGADATILHHPAAEGSKSQLEMEGQRRQRPRRSNRRRASKPSKPAKGSSEVAGEMSSTLKVSDGDAKSQDKMTPTSEELNYIAHEERFISFLEPIILQQPAAAAKASKSKDSFATKLEEQGRWEIINMYFRYQIRRGPPHPKRRASRHSKPSVKGSKSQTSMEEVINASDGDGDAEVEPEEMGLKQPVVRMVVKPLASTAFTSDSD